MVLVTIHNTVTAMKISPTITYTHCALTHYHIYTLRTHKLSHTDSHRVVEFKGRRCLDDFHNVEELRFSIRANVRMPGKNKWLKRRQKTIYRQASQTTVVTDIRSHRYLYMDKYCQLTFNASCSNARRRHHLLPCHDVSVCRVLARAKSKGGGGRAKRKSSIYNSLVDLNA